MKKPLQQYTRFLPEASASSVVTLRSFQKKMFIALTCAVLVWSSFDSIAQEEIDFASTHGNSRTLCGGVGLCRLTMVESASTTAPTNDNEGITHGQLSMNAGRMTLSLTRVVSKKALRMSDIEEVPLEYDTDLPAEKARRLGFSSITLQRGRYQASSPGVFPLLARYSFGLGVAPNPTPFPARIRFESLQPLNASVYIFDRAGNRIATLLENEKCTPARTSELLWDGTTASGNMAGRGVYTVELRVTLPRGGSFAETQTLVVQ